MDSVLQLVGLRNATQKEEREENNKQILVATVVNTTLPGNPGEEEVQETNQNQASQSDSSHSENLNEEIGWKQNLTFLEQSSIKSTVAQHTVGITSNTDKIRDESDEEYVQYGSEDGVGLGKVSTCSGEIVEFICNLPAYMLKDGKKKGEFLIDNVLKEENEMLDCDSNINEEEKDDLHLMTDVSKEVQQNFKEDKEAVMDDLWVNGVLVKKAGDTKINRLTIPDQWEPPT
eukprot:13538327-Ditylum_brightwellii.AAC.1